MIAGRSSTLRLRLLRTITALALVWPGALLAHAHGSAHAPATGDPTAAAQYTPDRASAPDVDSPAAALPGPSAELVGSHLSERPVSRTDSPAGTRRHARNAFRPLQCVQSPASSNGTTPEVREPTLRCGFVSSRPTAPPAFRS